MGLCISCKKEKKQWPVVCFNENYIKWSGNMPKIVLNNNFEISNMNYKYLLDNIVSSNIHSNIVINNVIGNSRNQNPRLIRISKLLNMKPKSLYYKLQFLSSAYPRVECLAKGLSEGFHGFTEVNKIISEITYVDDDQFYPNVKKNSNELFIFNPHNLAGEYHKIKNISWNQDKINNTNFNKIKNIIQKKIMINNENKIDIENILKELNVNDEYNYWSSSTFINSIFESKINFDNKSLKFIIHKYISTKYYIIRNGNIPQLLNFSQKKLFLNYINSLKYFKNDKLSFDEIFDTHTSIINQYEDLKMQNKSDSEKIKNLRYFFNLYTIVNENEFRSNLDVEEINSKFILTADL